MRKYHITPDSRYLVLPINPHAKRKNILFYEGDSLVWEFNAPIDFLTPRFTTYMDLAHLMGKAVTLTCTPRADLDFDFCGEIPAGAGMDEPYRPMVHFTARLGWTNDPNGLVYVNGLYHMFFQHNPADSSWGNMTWGHAVSTDLLHWQQLDSALVPDKMGDMFSGSGIVDKHNVSGLGNAENPAVLFYYTAAGGGNALSAGASVTQCMAYSLDGGMTLHKHAGNPVIPHIIGGNRDPKVVWCDELGCYLLALYMDGDEYALFTTDDLLHFKELQRLSLPGDAECPDIYPLEAENRPGERKWVFSGASDRYVVGEFRDGKFCAVQDALPYSHSRARKSYAAQTFSDVEGRRIKIAWESFTAPDACFNSQMGIPTEVSLCRVGDVYRLRTRPCREFESLREQASRFALSQPDFALPLERNAYDLELALEADCPDLTLRFLGYEFSIQPSANALKFEKDEMPLSYTGEPVTLRIICDTLGCEIFADNGLVYTVCSQLADYNLRYLTVETASAAVPKATLTVHPLRSTN